MKPLNAAHVVLLVAALATGSPPAAGQTYPAKPIRWIVPFPPGGGTDLISRALAQKLAEAWGQQVVADNRPGSGGTLGLGIAAKAPGDGYTVVLGQLANMAIAPGLYRKLPYDPLRDFAPVTQVIATPLILVSHPSFPAKNVKELVALARAKPDLVTFGSPGNGTTGHLAAEMIKTAAKVRMLHVPYKGASPALTDLLGGQITIYVSSIPPALPLIKAGRLKALGITSAKRLPGMPEVPTIAESGIPGYEVTNWYGVLVPAGTPREIVARLHAELVRIMQLPDVRERFTSEGGDVVGNTPEQFSEFIKREIPKWTRAVRDSGARVD
ncbi:MAG: tripartite tricarboxylate transporter substrate binding protein [Betaproteobacteria bacterium]|nr:tripartite tricarboxylate transporter substrate binding protein [Betaproteobacteria bacterium]MBI3937543.1 tripartite tricarboxylate transporter substrate binding protein [Betaproteobacteria bacterium]